MSDLSPCYVIYRRIILRVKHVTKNIPLEFELKRSKFKSLTPMTVDLLWIFYHVQNVTRTGSFLLNMSSTGVILKFDPWWPLTMNDLQSILMFRMSWESYELNRRNFIICPWWPLTSNDLQSTFNLFRMLQGPFMLNLWVFIVGFDHDKKGYISFCIWNLHLQIAVYITVCGPIGSFCFNKVDFWLKTCLNQKRVTIGLYVTTRV